MPAAAKALPALASRACAGKAGSVWFFEFVSLLFGAFKVHIQRHSQRGQGDCQREIVHGSLSIKLNIWSVPVHVDEACSSGSWISAAAPKLKEL